jgi:hypothetical protein
MAIPFALRPRIRLREEPERARAVAVPPMALPVGAYWVVMGLLTYGVSQAPSFLSGARAPGATPTVRDVPTIETPPIAPVTSRPAQGSTPLELAPAWNLDAPPPRDMTHTPPAKSEPVLARVEVPTAEDRDHGLARGEPPSKNVREESAPLPARQSLARAHERVPAWASGDDAWLRPPNAAQQTPAPHDPAPTPDTPHASPSRAARLTTGSGLPSCESVLARENDEIDMTTGRGAPDLSRDAYAAILENGSYLAACSVPSDMALDICAAVRNGRAVGVTVSARPADARVSACVRGAIAALAYPTSVRLDVTRTRFDAVHAGRGR